MPHPSANPLLVLVAGFLSFLIFVFQLMLWTTLIVSIVRSVRPDWRPTGILLLLIDFALRTVEKPLRFIRRFIPPLDLGAVRLDLAWMILFFATIILGQIVGGIPRMA